MRVIDPGHEYELHQQHQAEQPSDRQFIRFGKKREIQPGLEKMETVKSGTTNEEVISVLIHRIKYLDSIMPCDQNKEAIKSLELALNWLDLRTRDRQRRKVEGTTKN